MSNNVNSIGVVGCGFVGKAVIRGFSGFVKEVNTYDVDPKRCYSSFEDTINSDIVFVCLPTPMVSVEGGEANLSIIYDFFEKVNNIKKRNYKKIFAIKSTIPVGTTKKIIEKTGIKSIVHCPEFLRASSFLIDFLTPSRNIIGGNHKESIYKLKKLLNERFPGVHCYIMDSDASEMVKYMVNCFLATKVLFFNEMRLLADQKDMNWNDVIDGVLSDGRIGLSHYQVPGPDGDMGFGGLCFSKDINALISTMEENGIDPKLLKAVWEQNKTIRKNWDWAESKSSVMEDK